MTSCMLKVRFRGNKHRKFNKRSNKFTVIKWDHFNGKIGQVEVVIVGRAPQFEPESLAKVTKWVWIQILFYTLMCLIQ